MSSLCQAAQRHVAFARNCGTGKTHLAIAIMRERLRRGESSLKFVKHRHFLAEHWRALRPVPFGEEPPESPLESCQSSTVQWLVAMPAAIAGVIRKALCVLQKL